VVDEVAGELFLGEVLGRVGIGRMRSEERVTAAAADLGIDVEVRAFPSGTRTARDAAAAIGCEVAQIVKSLVFVADDEPIVALVGGADRLDERKLALVAGVDSVRRADADEVRLATGYAIGGVPPFGHAQVLRCFVDDALLSHDVVWAAAGTPSHVFASQPSVLVSAAGAQIAPLRLSA
jgi:prolyl-tRNA editing enzyme YbaK/EbsC (Cys-tRNA(Pro) deacylase)